MDIEKQKAEEAAKAKAAVEAAAAADESCPIFRVEQAPGFTTGLQTYGPGELIRWEKPEGWKNEKYGKHFSEYGPSITFAPMNEKAKKMMIDHKEKLRQFHAPKPTASDKLLEAVVEGQKQQAQTLDLLTKLVAKLVEKK